MSEEFRKLLQDINNDLNYDFSSQEDFLEFIYEMGISKGKAEKLYSETLDTKIDWILTEYGQWTSRGYLNETYEEWRERIKKSLLKS